MPMHNQFFPNIYFFVFYNIVTQNTTAENKKTKRDFANKQQIN